LDENGKSNKLKALRSEYYHFDEYLIGKETTDDILLLAFKHQIKKHSSEKIIDLELEDTFIDKNASRLLALIRDLLNLSKSDRTLLFTAALICLTGKSSWNDLEQILKKFNEYSNNLSDFDPSEEFDVDLEALDHHAQLNKEEKKMFHQLIVFKLVKFETQNWESPHAYEGIIQGGLLKNESGLVSKSTFNRHKSNIDENNPLFEELLDVIAIFKDNIEQLMNILAQYNLKFKSTYTQSLNSDSNFAIKLPLYEDVDYDKVLTLANQNLKPSGNSNSSKNISIEKIVLFLFLAQHDRCSGSRLYISLNKYSKYIGDSKVTSAIIKALVQEGILINKIAALPEVRPNSYEIDLSFEVSGYTPILDPFILNKLNNQNTLKREADLQYKLILLNKVADIISTYQISKKSNLTKVFLKSGKTFPIIYLLKIINALKSRFTHFKVKIIDQNLMEVIETIEYDLAGELYLKLYSKLSYHLNSSRIRLNFNVPHLYLITEDDIEEQLKIKIREEYLKNEQNLEKAKHEILKELTEERNSNFILQLQEI